MLGIRTPEPFRADNFQDCFLDQPDTYLAKHPVEECFTAGINPATRRWRWSRTTRTRRQQFYRLSRYHLRYIHRKNKVVMFFDIQNSQTFSLLVKLDLGISSKDCTGFHVLHIRRTVPLFTDLIGHDPITPRLTDECSAS